MLATILLLLLVFECGLYAVAGALLVGNGMLSLGMYLVLALLLALMLRVLLLLFTFVYSHALMPTGDASRALSATRKMTLLAVESLAYLILFKVLQPFEPWLMRDARALHSTKSGVAIVFVHGIYCNGAVWWWLRRQLKRRGVQSMYAINLEPLFAGIDVFAAQLEHALQIVRGGDLQKKVVLVTHSMGGLVARACLQHADAQSSVIKLITLGAPHHGSRLAELAIGTNGKQLRTSSAWLQELERREGGIVPVPTVSIFSWHDNFVTPQASAVLQGANNIALTGVGHLGLFFSKNVAQYITNEIDQIKDACRA